MQKFRCVVRRSAVHPPVGCFFVTLAEDLPVPSTPVPTLAAPDRARVRARRKHAGAGEWLTSTGAELRSVASPVVPELGEDVRAVVAARRAHARAANTTRTYDSAWRRFEGWCAAHGLVALPAHPETVAAYLALADDVRDEGGAHAYAQSTLAVWNAAIGERHNRAGYAHPGRDVVVAEVLSGIAWLRTQEGEEPDQAAALRLHDLRRVVTAIADGAPAHDRHWAAQVHARRDTALLVLGYTGALRRSELGKLWIADVTEAGDPDREWLALRLRGTKTSRTAKSTVVVKRGDTTALTCPWCAHLRWLTLVVAYDRAAAAAAEPEQARDDGEVAIRTVLRRDPDPTLHLCDQPWPWAPKREVALFRALDRNLPTRREPLTGGAIARMIKRRAAQAGYSEQQIAALRGHSLRAGWDTDALAAGATHSEVGRHARQTERTVSGYDRRAQFENHPSSRLDI